MRIVSASELHAEAILNDDDTPSESRDEQNPGPANGVEYIVQGDGNAALRSNRNIVDDPNRQTLSLEEIEELKKLSTGKDIVEALMQAHSGIDEKTAFSLAKYTFRKRGKYFKRFTVLPLDVSRLLEWVVTEKDAPRIMDLREEMLGLILCWSNVHCMIPSSNPDEPEEMSASGRWLVIDETGGLLVAALAEKIGILYPPEEHEDNDDEDHLDGSRSDTMEHVQEECHQQAALETKGVTPDRASHSPSTNSVANELSSKLSESYTSTSRPRKRMIGAQSATSNTITLLHAAAQPNVALLKYFGFDENNPGENHPLYTHLRTLSWLQMLSPEEDSTYQEPEVVPDELLQSWRSGKRSNYFRKRRRWGRVKAVVDDARRGQFDGLLVASIMEPAEILHHLLPLLKGGAQVVVYSPNVEPLVELADLFSRARRTAFLTNPPEDGEMPTEDFPLDPTLLLNTMVQTSRARSWQVLPGRTHPMMMGRGGAEGYVFTGTRVLRGEAPAKARGRFSKKRRAE